MCYNDFMADIVYPGEVAGGPINSGAMPSNQDLSIYEGDAVKFTVTVTDSNAAPINLTGYTAQAQLKTSFADASPIDFVCTLTTPTAGVVTIYMAPATTAGLTAGGTYIWDFQLTEPGGDVRTYLAGDVNVIPEVTT